VLGSLLNLAAVARAAAAQTDDAAVVCAGFKGRSRWTTPTAAGGSCSSSG
jgi:phosphosulfolactate phosphohydrolase-like enzyme